MIKLSESLSLPLALVNQTQAVLGRKGSGKTSTARRQAEQMLFARQQVVALDPTGAWWGLRASADGKGVGFPILVIGGDHGDIPLDENAGETIARAIVEERFSAVIDLSLLGKNARQRFMVAFLETLYRLNREAMHLFVDEADMIAPQRPQPDDARMLGAMQDIVRRGRKMGIGCTLITQRPQVLNKDVLTQCEVLTVLRLTHPRDLDAINEWVNYQGDSKLGEEMIRSLPSLKIGTAWFWAPGWPTEDGIFQKVAVDRCVTFDSGATPEPGKAARKPKALARVDIAKLGQAIASTAEQVKANDPRVLKVEIQRLKEELAKRPASQSKVIEKQVFRKGEIERLEKLSANLSQKLHDFVKELGETAIGIQTHIGRMTSLVKVGADHSLPSLPSLPLPGLNPRLHSTTSSEVGAANPDLKITSGLRRILTALAEHPEGLTRKAIGILAGLSITTGSFSTYLSQGRTNGWLVDNGELLFITLAGLKHIGSVSPLPRGKELQEYWKRKLPSGPARIFGALVAHFPSELSREQIGALSALSVTTGSFSTYLSSLRSLNLIEGTNPIRASSKLFD